MFASFLAFSILSNNLVYFSNNGEEKNAQQNENMRMNTRRF